MPVVIHLAETTT